MTLLVSAVLPLGVGRYCETSYSRTRLKGVGCNGPVPCDFGCLLVAPPDMSGVSCVSAHVALDG